jgi:Carboxypeptidase regulatory-like domain/TonB-dependent Receptor Plug Domain
MKSCRFLSLVVCLACCCVTAFAQSPNASLTGFVDDPSKAMIPKASITAINTQTGVKSSTTSNSAGQYVLQGLIPGSYRIEVDKQGFKGIIEAGLVLHVQDVVQMNFHMAVGSMSETVSVNASGSNINTTDASVSTVVDREFVGNIPLNGRSFQDLILLTPGVTTNSPQSTGASGATGEFSVNGQRTESNAYTVDGVSANTGGYVYGYGTAGTSGSLPSATALGTTQSLVSVDALQEFRVASSSYSAEYGLSPGGQFAFATRSGTNLLHGTAFDYLRNNYFDANNWFNDNLGVPVTALRQNDFGGTLGGPIWLPKLYDGRNRSFFFFSYEGLRLTQPQAATTYYVPSASLRQNSPASLQPVLNAFPIATGSALSNGLAPFVQTDSNPSSIDSTSIRLDQQITPKVKAFYRFGNTQSATQTRLLSVFSLTSQTSSINTLGVTWVLSERIANEFRANYTSSVGQSFSNLDNFGGAQPINLLQSQGLDPNSIATAYAAVGLTFPGYSPQVSQGGTTQPQHTWNFVESVTIDYGRQTVKAGVDYRETASRLQAQNPFVATYFNSSQAVLENSSYLSYVYNYARDYPVYTNTGLYVQDEIRANQRLGISLGLRWEVNPPPTEANGVLPYILEGDSNDVASWTLAPAGTRFWKTTYYNFAPRLGVNYQAHNQPGRETVVRVGGGVFFDTGQQNSTQAFGSSPGQSASATYSNVSYPLTTAQLAVPIINPPVPPYAYGFYFPAKIQLPYTLQWNVSLEQALGRAQAITLSYVGSNGRRLLYDQILVPGAVNPNFSFIYDEKSGTTSNYGALQVKFQRRLSRGVQMLASYNWSHSIDYGSQNQDFAYVRGNSDFDVRHNFNAAVTYDTHSGTSNKFLNSLLDAWGLNGRFSARTAFPVVLNGNEIFEPNGQYGYTGLNLAPLVPLYLHVAGIAGNREINPAAFSIPEPGENGNAPRNFVRGFAASQIDFGVQRTFPISGPLSLLARAEAFNLLNHPNFGYIQSDYGNAQFGQATKTLDQSLGNLSPLYQQGGPRSMQFALKLIF